MTDLPESTIDRYDLLPHLFPDPGAYLLIAGLAGAAPRGGETQRSWREESSVAGTTGEAAGAPNWHLGPCTPPP